jgi:hypothetical protein
VFSCRKKWLHGYKTLNNFSLEPLWAHVLSKSIALHFLCRCHLRQGQATKKVILDYTLMTLKYLDAVILFLSGWLRKEGIVIESARKIVEGLADDGDKLYDRLATLEDTYSKAQMKSKGTKGCLKFLSSTWQHRQSLSNPKKKYKMYFLKTGAMTMPLQAI